MKGKTENLWLFWLGRQSTMMTQRRHEKRRCQKASSTHKSFHWVRQSTTYGTIEFLYTELANCSIRNFRFPISCHLMIFDAPEHKDNAGNDSKCKCVGEVSKKSFIIIEQVSN